MRPGEAQQADGARARVLAVDDHPANLRAVEAVLEVVAHELRNPLSVIRTTADLLLRRLGEADQVSLGRRTCAQV